MSKLIDKKYLNAFNLIGGFGWNKIQKITNYFSNLENGWNASESDLQKAGLSGSALENLLSKRDKINPEKELEKVYLENLEILTIFEENYPQPLKEIYNPPAALYIKGKIPQSSARIGIVGSRKITSYGKQTACFFAKNLALQGAIIVSGLAFGTDTIAHCQALEAGQETIAVLGSGIDKNSIYPAANKKLAEAIASQGALISEFPVGAAPLRQNFPLRNRIISGLSLAVLVIEASQSSGALITAKFALEQNREVFAVPGSIFSENSIGTNNLIKMGAKPAITAEEILEDLNIKAIIPSSKKQFAAETLEEKLILENLSREPIHIDKISEMTKLDIAVISATIIMLEMKGLVKNLGGMMFVIG
ncbi:MAG: DNA-processing protein DprA [bacterium]